jgi:hypothetical protein
MDFLLFNCCGGQPCATKENNSSIAEVKKWSACISTLA